jgi:hypothetical protein
MVAVERLENVFLHSDSSSKKVKVSQRKPLVQLIVIKIGGPPY